MCEEAVLQSNKQRDRPRLAALYHILTAALTIFCGASLFALGIWLRATDNGVPLNLHYGGDNWNPLFLNFGAGFMAVGAFLLFTTALAQLSFSHRASATIFRTFYVALSLAIVAALVVACIVSALLAARMWTPRTRDTLRKAWDLSARIQPSTVCDIEARLKCRGLDDDECADCPTGLQTGCIDKATCVACERGVGETETDTGCYGRIAAAVRRVFVPIAVVSGVVGAVVVGDLFTSRLL